MAFNITAVNLINALLISVGIGVCALCFLQISASAHLQKTVRRYFQLFFLLILLYITAHLVRELLERRPGGGVHTALQIVTFVEMLAAGFTSLMISMLVLFLTRPDGKDRRRLFFALTALLLLHAAVLIVGCFTGWSYYFDGSNVYHRGAAYTLSNLAPLGMLCIDVALLLRHGKRLAPRVRSAFWVYMIAPIAAILIQLATYGVQVIIFATVGAAVYMFSVIVRSQNAEYAKQQLEASRIETELSMATRIQASMLPNIFPAFPERPEFEIYASMDPAKEVGGDFYDFFFVDENHLCLIIADVSGKGVPAALFMMASKIILQSSAGPGLSPAEILTRTNEAIRANNQEEMFVTVWLGILELSTGRLTAANAGHEKPILKSPGGEFEALMDKHGIVVGVMDGIRYREYEVQLLPGAKLFLYTDGVPEAARADGEIFGIGRTLAALNEHPDANPVELLKNVRSAVDGFVRDAEQFDDLTMLCVEYKGKDAALAASAVQKQ